MSSTASTSGRSAGVLSRFRGEVGHRKKVCVEHGRVLEECRCPGPKTAQYVPCPYEDETHSKVKIEESDT